LEAYARRHPAVTLRKINIARWGSPVAEQYGIRSIPHLLLYKDGALVASGTDEVMGRLER
jgi:thioredoxin-like negative regulator of GroEL